MYTVCMGIYLYVYVFLYVYIWLSVYVYIEIIHTRICTHICNYIYGMHVYIHIHILAAKGAGLCTEQQLSASDKHVLEAPPTPREPTDVCKRNTKFSTPLCSYHRKGP